LLAVVCFGHRKIPGIASNGPDWCRTVFAEINKAAADTLGITWTVTVN
jgi:hypothetical protein